MKKILLFQSLRSRILLLMVSVVLLSSSVLIILVQNETEEAILSAQTENAENVLEILLLIVENQYKSVAFHKEAMLARRKEELKNIIAIEMLELETIYSDYLRGRFSEEEAKRRAIEKLKPVRYDNGIGYIWINDTARPFPKMIMHPTIPELDGLILDDPTFNTGLGRGVNLFTAFVDVCLADGEGYVDYMWPKPIGDGLSSYQPKISYVKLFEPWDWIIGTGVYIDDIEREGEKRIEAVIAELEGSLERIRVAKTGYFYIFKGDSTMLIHPNIPRGDDLSSLIDVATGESIYVELVEASKREDRTLRYLWDAPGYEKEYIFRKLSFVEYFEPLDWYICSSVYEDEIEAPAKMLTGKIVYISIVIILIALILSYILSNSLIRPVKMLSLSVKDIDQQGIESLNIPIMGTIETKELGRTLKSTLNSLKESQERLESYQNHLEEEVKMRTKEVEDSNRALLSAKDAAESANRAKSIFLANMSHEIRTPMNAILGFADILSSEEREPEKLKYISNIISAGNALLNLINHILDLSKVEAGKLELQYGPTSMTRLIDEIKVIFEHKVREKGLGFIIRESGENPGFLLLDKTRIREILINLLGNAIKFTEDGAIELIINYAASDRREKSTVDLVIRVKDSGCGIASEELQKIFLPFEQQKGQKIGTYGGTGLGLAITKRLVNMMNGEIEVESQLGKGSTFTLNFREVEIAIGGSYEELDRDSYDLKALKFESRLILVVDDIDFNRELLRKYLSDYELTVVEAKNGREAIELMREIGPDLVLMDMKMPVMGGYEAIEHIKRDDKIKDIPIIAITASAMKGEEELISRVCNSYLAKPIRKSELIRGLLPYIPHTIVKDDYPDEEAAEQAVEVDLGELPQETLREMRELAFMGDVDGLDELIERLKGEGAQYGSLCQRLSELTGQYKIEEIIKLIDRI